MNKYAKQRVSPCHVRLIFPDPKDADEFMAADLGRFEQGDRYWRESPSPTEARVVVKADAEVKEQ